MRYEPSLNSDILSKYEDMLESGKKSYFDTDEIEVVAYEYENKDAIQEALEAVDFGLNIHPNNETLLILKTKYLLYLDFIKESREIYNKLPQNIEELIIINIELLFAENKLEKAYSLINENINKSSLDEEFCYELLPVLWGYCSNEKIEYYIKKCEIGRAHV